MAKRNHMMESYTAPTLMLVSGTGRGRAYELGEGRLSIGRSDECDIILPNESVSRVHAYVEKGEDGLYVIFDNGSKNGVVLNGERVEAAPLREGDVLQLGNFGLQYFTGEVHLEEAGGAQDYGAFPLAEPAPAKKGINKRVLLYGGLGLVIAYVVMQGNSSETTTDAETPAGTEATARPGFQVADAPQWDDPNQSSKVPGLRDPVLKSVEEDLSKVDLANNALRESEQYFRRGQREFSNKNFQRAIDAFSAALSINKKHPLARYYLDAAIHQSETTAENHRQTAVKYFESLQFHRAVHHFQQAIAYMAHRPNDPKIQQCERGIELAKQKLQTVEIFP